MGETAHLAAYARLNSLKANLPDHHEVHEKWVAEFHAVLDLLEAVTGQSLASFRVPSAEVRPRVTSVRMATRHTPGKVSYSRDNYCERAFLVMKTDGVLNYFSYQTAPRQRRIGYPPASE